MVGKWMIHRKETKLKMPLDALFPISRGRGMQSLSQKNQEALVKGGRESSLQDNHSLHRLQTNEECGETGADSCNCEEESHCYSG